MVFETVPEKEMQRFGDTNRLLQFLEKEKGKFHTAKKLAIFFNFRTSGTQVELRKTITEFLEQGYPIISTGQGFSWASNKQQMLYYISTLESRVQGINRRILSLKKGMGGM